VAQDRGAPDALAVELSAIVSKRRFRLLREPVGYRRACCFEALRDSLVISRGEIDERMVGNKVRLEILGPHLCRQGKSDPVEIVRVSRG